MKFISILLLVEKYGSLWCCDLAGNRGRVQWNWGEAQMECLPASTAGGGSMTCVGEGLCNTSVWDNWRGTCNTFAVWKLVIQKCGFYGAVKVVTCLDGIGTKPQVLSYEYQLMG